MSSLNTPQIQEKKWDVGTLSYTLSGLIVLFLFLLAGDFVWNLKERAITPLAQLLLKNLSATDLMIGLLIGSLPAALGLVIGPIVGIKSDNFRSNWGRRIPFLLIPTPFIFLSMLGIGLNREIGAILHESLGGFSPGNIYCCIIIFSFFWTLFEIATIIANSVFGGLINDVVPVQFLGRFYGLFRAVGLIAGILFNYFLIGKAESHTKELFFGIGLIYSVGITIMCLNIKEGAYPEPEQSHDHNYYLKIKKYFNETFSLPYYRWCFFAISFGLISMAPINSFGIFYAKSLGMSVEEYGKYISITYTVSLLLSYSLGSLSDRFHPLKMGLISMGVYFLIILFGALFIHDTKSFGIVFVLHGIFSGTYATLTASLPQRLFPKNQFGQFSSALGIVTGLMFGIVTPLSGALLDWSHHQYQYTFLVGAFLALFSLFCLYQVYKKFKLLGGELSYKAP